MRLKPIPLAASLLCTAAAWAADPAAALPEMTVTGTREGELLSETPATIGIIGDQTLRETRPTHPKDVLNQVPGVWVSNLSGAVFQPQCAVRNQRPPFGWHRSHERPGQRLVRLRCHRRHDQRADSHAA
jgi:hypothetical protein